MVIREQRFSFNQVRRVLGGVLEHDLHAKRVASLCDATLGVMRSASLAVCMIGQGLAAARGLNPMVSRSSSASNENLSLRRSMKLSGPPQSSGGQAPPPPVQTG